MSALDGNKLVIFDEYVTLELHVVTYIIYRATVTCVPVHLLSLPSQGPKLQRAGELVPGSCTGSDEHHSL